MNPIQPKVMFCLLGALLPSLCAAGVMRQYNEELGQTIALVQSGTIPQALAQIEKANEGPDKDILYFLERGEVLSVSGDYPASRETWLKGDEIIQAWENDFRTNSAQLFGNIGSYLISDKTRRYDGQDYEKVMLSTRLTLNHIMLGSFDLARIEMKKTYEREKLIEAFREKEYDALKIESEKQTTSQVTQLDGYPMAELDTPEVRELKNGFQNAFAHYLAGYFFEVTGEPSLAEPGYRNALQLAPGKATIQNALDGVGKTRSNPDQTDVLFVIETGFAPSIESMSIPIPVPRKDGVVVIPLSFPLIKSSPPVMVPPALTVSGQSLTVETLTNTDTMARRLLKDQMPGIILRTIIRASFKSLIQEQANKAHWLAGLIANAVAVGTEQADDRNWRTLPERISIARATLPQGKHRIEFQSNAGSYQSEIEVAGRFTIIPIRLTGAATYVGRSTANTGEQAGHAPLAVINPQGAGLTLPAKATIPANTPMTSPVPTRPDGQANASASAQSSANLGKRVTVGDTTYIGDFIFAQPSGLASGKGIIEWRNGDQFEGEMKNGEFDGHGSYTTKNGIRYEGGWKNGVKEGQGRTTFADGDYWEDLQQRQTNRAGKDDLCQPAGQEFFRQCGRC